LVALALSQAKKHSTTTSSGPSGAEIADDVFLLPDYAPVVQDNLAVSVATLLPKKAGAADN
jgi:hypothetical protein